MGGGRSRRVGLGAWKPAGAASAAPANSIDQSFDCSSAPPLCTAGTSGCLLPKQRPRTRADVVDGESIALKHLAARRGCAEAVDAEDVAMVADVRSDEHTSELQSLMRISSAVFCLKKKHTKA